MKLFHVSDVHFGAEDPAALAWFATCVAAEAPQAVVMTGDLTMRAKRAEFEAGGRWLRSLGVPVTVEIGNHDIPYYSDPVGRLLRPYARYAAAEKLIEQPLTLPGVRVVPLQTVARAQWRIDQSKGQVSSRSLAEALAMIGTASPGDLILVAAHHPLVDPRPGGREHTHGGRAALDALAAAGAHAVLSGHVHDPFDLPYERDGRTIRLIGAGTLSKRLRRSPPAFNELRIENGQLQMILRTLSPEPDRVIESMPADAPG